MTRVDGATTGTPQPLGAGPMTPPLYASPTEPVRTIPRRAVASWVLYDLANTIFSMGVVSL